MNPICNNRIWGMEDIKKEKLTFDHKMIESAYYENR